MEEWISARISQTARHAHAQIRSLVERWGGLPHAAPPGGTGGRPAASAAPPTPYQTITPESVDSAIKQLCGITGEGSIREWCINQIVNNIKKNIYTIIIDPLIADVDNSVVVNLFSSHHRREVLYVLYKLSRIIEDELGLLVPANELHVYWPFLVVSDDMGVAPLDIINLIIDGNDIWYNELLDYTIHESDVIIRNSSLRCTSLLTHAVVEYFDINLSALNIQHLYLIASSAQLALTSTDNSDYY